MNAGDAIKAALELKEKGNELFKKREFAKAKSQYCRMFLYTDQFFHGGYDKLMDDVKSPETISEEHMAEIKLLKTVGCSNAAACMLHLKRYKEAMDFAQRALDLDAGNKKALFRRGAAAMHCALFKQSEEDLKAAAAAGYSQAAVDQKLAELQKLMARQKQKERKAFKGMFDKVSLS